MIADQDLGDVQADGALRMTGPRLSPGQPGEQRRLAHEPLFELGLRPESGDELGDRHVPGIGR